MSTLTNEDIGKTVQFSALRIIHGNPVEGELISVSDSSIEVKLSHAIEGINTVWGAGDIRDFKLIFLSKIKVLKGADK